MIVTTHYLDEAERCDRIALMHAGRLVASGSVAELKQVFAGRALLEITSPRILEAHERLEREPWILEASVFGTRIHAVVADPDEGGRRARELLTRSGLLPVEVHRIVPSLEDVFIHCIEAEEAARSAPAPA
jgi:ABC-2 type transport system ATP-binding protein